jgi:hypothetical protein
VSVVVPVLVANEMSHCFGIVSTNDKFAACSPFFRNRSAGLEPVADLARVVSGRCVKRNARALGRH